MCSLFKTEIPLAEYGFLQSDYCTECGGLGFITLAINTHEQCEECERLHNLELRADRLCDELKGN